MNVFVRKADIVKIACIAQSAFAFQFFSSKVNILLLYRSVNVISPVRSYPPPIFANSRIKCHSQIITSPTGLFKQTTFYPLKLFSTFMRGASLDIHVQSLSFEGPTVPPFIQHLTLHTPESARLTKFVDARAVLSSSTSPAEIRVAIVNRSETDSYWTRFAFGPDTEVEDSVRVYEIWSNNLKDTNGFGDEEDKVKVVQKLAKLDARKEYMLKSHSFQSKLFPADAGKVFLIWMQF